MIFQLGEDMKLIYFIRRESWPNTWYVLIQSHFFFFELFTQFWYTLYVKVYRDVPPKWVSFPHFYHFVNIYIIVLHDITSICAIYMQTVHFIMIKFYASMQAEEK